MWVLLSALLKVLNGDLGASSRLVFAMRRKRLIDGRLGRVHLLHQTPYVAVLLVGFLKAACMLLGESILIPITEVGSRINLMRKLISQDPLSGRIRWLLGGILAVWVANVGLAQTVPLPSGWRLVWSDEFKGPPNSPPSPDKWTYDLGSGWGNGELEVYTDSIRNAYQDGHGHLVIKALRSASGGYTSARLKTWKKFAVEYGRIEARIKIPYGQGLWPAFWMLGANIQDPGVGWPQCGEVDIMENIGREPGIIHGTIHGPGYSGAHGIGKPYELPAGERFALNFHLFSVDWEPAAIRFAVDRHVYHVVTPANLPAGAHWVYDHPFFLLLNVAVGGNWPGVPDSTTKFPQKMLVDYVRVYQRQHD
jgi:beta-glucanase (GH16 family)